MKPGTVLYFPAQERIYVKDNSDKADQFLDLTSYETAQLDLSVSKDRKQDWIEYPHLGHYLKALGWTKLPKEQSMEISRKMAHSMGLEYGPDVWSSYTPWGLYIHRKKALNK